jgi:hypothetical protein
MPVKAYADEPSDRMAPQMRQHVHLLWHLLWHLIGGIVPDTGQRRGNPR